MSIFNNNLNPDSVKIFLSTYYVKCFSCCIFILTSLVNLYLSFSNAGISTKKVIYMYDKQTFLDYSPQH